MSERPEGRRPGDGGVPDFRRLVLDRIPELGLDGTRQADLVDEFAVQLEEIYESLQADGWSLADALAEAERSLASDEAGWTALAQAADEATGRTVRSHPAGRGSRARSGGGSGPAVATRKFLSRTVARPFRKNPAFAAAVVAILAIVIGVNSAVFAIVKSVLLEPLPFPESDRVVLLANQSSNSRGLAIRTTVPSYFDRLEYLTVFEDFAMFRWIDVAIDAGDGPQRVRGTVGTPSLLRLIEVDPLYGRIFDDEEAAPGAERKIVLAYDLWQELFGGDATVVGTRIRVDSQPFEIVGVMPEGFGIFRLDARFWTPAVYSDAQRADNRRNSNDQYQVGRLRPGATLAEARAQIDRLNAINLERFPDLREGRERTGFYVSVDPVRDVMTREVSPTLRLLWGGARLVLVVGLLNLANLTAARAGRLAGSLATRRTLGAGPWDLAREELGHAVPLALAGWALGIGLGRGTLRILGSSGLDQIPRSASIRMDGTVVVAAFAVAMTVAILIGVVPALRSCRIGRGPDSSAGPHRHLARRGLVITQVASACVLLIGAGLLGRSFQNLASVDPGFEPEELFTATYDLPASRYTEPASMTRFTEEVVDRIVELPGVVSAGATHLLPFSGRQHALWAVRSDPAPAVPDRHRPSWYYVVSPGYLETMKIPLIEGRYFTRADSEAAVNHPDKPGAVIVDEVLARRLWPGEDAVGGRLQFTRDADGSALKTYDVVGVVGAVRHQDLASGPDAAPGATYLPYPEDPQRTQTLVARTARDPDSIGAAIRSVVSGMDPDLPLYDIETMPRRTRLSLAPRNLALVLAVVFASTAVVLTAIAIYGVLAYAVEVRRREFGIRRALGSTVRQLFTLVLRAGIALVAAGLGIGVLAAYLLRNVLAEQVYRISPTDPWMFGAVGVAIGAVGVLACLAPAIQAARVDPVTILSDS